MENKKGMVKEVLSILERHYHPKEIASLMEGFVFCFLLQSMVILPSKSYFNMMDLHSLVPLQPYTYFCNMSVYVIFTRNFDRFNFIVCIAWGRSAVRMKS